MNESYDHLQDLEQSCGLKKGAFQDFLTKKEEFLKGIEKERKERILEAQAQASKNLSFAA